MLMDIVDAADYREPPIAFAKNGRPIRPKWQGPTPGREFMQLDEEWTETQLALGRSRLLDSPERHARWDEFVRLDADWIEAQPGFCGLRTIEKTAVGPDVRDVFDELERRQTNRESAAVEDAARRTVTAWRWAIFTAAALMLLAFLTPEGVARGLNFDLSRFVDNGLRVLGWGATFGAAFWGLAGPTIAIRAARWSLVRWSYVAIAALIGTGWILQALGLTWIVREVVDGISNCPPSAIAGCDQ